MSRLKDHWSVLLIALLLVLLYSLLPLEKAFELGQDEGFEVILPFMVNKGYALYTRIWNDQPPVFTMLLCGAFKVCGTSILTARLVACGFGLLLVCGFHELVRARSGTRTALFATFLLLASPSVLVLGASAMLECPAIATGLLAAWCLFKWGKKRQWFWLAASGAAMAAALQIKLTAILVAPALMVELLLLCRADNAQPWRGCLVRQTAIWFGCMGMSYLLIGVAWGRGSLATSWKSHTGTQLVPGLDRPTDHRFEPRLLRSHPECLAGAVLGVFLALRHKRWREVAFPLVLLGTAAAIHSVHRPWWNYYYLHLAVPLAWLTGWAANYLVQYILRLHAKTGLKFSTAGAWGVVGLCGVLALGLARAERRLESTVSDLRRRPATDANPIVKTMRQYADRTKWAYSESGIYPFHALVPVPPELAIIMPKRFWSGQISVGEIVETCKHYQPEMLVLPLTSHQEEWTALLAAEYVPVSRDTKCVLYLARRLKAVP